MDSALVWCLTFGLIFGLGVGFAIGNPEATGQSWRECTVSKPSGTECVEKVSREWIPVKVEE